MSNKGVHISFHHAICIIADDVNIYYEIWTILVKAQIADHGNVIQEVAVIHTFLLLGESSDCLHSTVGSYR